MTATEILANWDAKYERVNIDDTLPIYGHDSCSDMADTIRTLLQRRPFGSYKVCCVMNPFSTDVVEDDSDAFNELEAMLESPELRNVGWIIPAGDPFFDTMDLVMVLY